MAKKGVKVEVILPKNLPHDKKVKNWDITFLPVAHFPAVFGNLLYLPYLFKIYKKNKFQILRIHQPQFLGIGCLIFKIFKKDVKLFANYHRFKETNFGPFSKYINKKWDHIICDSENVKKKINQSYQVPKSKITVIHNGIPSYLKPTKKDPKLIKTLKLEGKFVMLFMGLFIKRKNPQFLIDVLDELVKRDKNYAVLFWGEGPLKERIIKKAQELGLLENIKFIKPVFGAKKNKIHNLADIFVHPSLDEGLALAPLEAMACAKPIIMTSGYSSKEIVEDGKNGYIVRANDIKDWSNKIYALSSNKYLSTRMSIHTLKKVVNDFNWLKSVQINFEVIKKLTRI